MLNKTTEERISRPNESVWYEDGMLDSLLKDVELKWLGLLVNILYAAFSRVAEMLLELSSVVDLSFSVEQNLEA